jgi:hypothetical protein
VHVGGTHDVIVRTSARTRRAGARSWNNPGMKRLLLTVLIALTIWMVLIMGARLLGFT